jgi:nucleoside-diphosphate-sugar epimerase
MQGCFMAYILIVGLGYIGNALADKLARQGHHVYGLCRSVREIKGTLIQKDLFDLSPEELPKELDYVFYMVGADGRDLEAYQRAYPQGVKKVIDCLSAYDCRVKRLFYISSTRVCQSLGEDWVTEETPLETEDLYAQTLFEAENIVNDSFLPSTIVRLGGIYGPGRTHLLSSVKNKTARLISNDIYTNRIHQADVVGLLFHMMNMKKVLEDLYLGVDSCPVLFNDLISWLAKENHVTLNRSVTKSKRKSKKISNAKLLTTGYKFQFPNFRSGYQDMCGPQSVANR